MNAREADDGCPGIESGHGISALRSDPQIEYRSQDGERVASARSCLRVSGLPAAADRERTAQYRAAPLGIARDAKYVKEIAGTHARLIDTPEDHARLRMLEKHAVVCGGGANHRLGLDAGVMIKDNHIAIPAASPRDDARARRRAALTRSKSNATARPGARGLAAKADVIMVDNMELEEYRGVKIVDGRIRSSRPAGGLNTIRAIAETGVDSSRPDRITQASQAVDIGLDDAREIGPARGHVLLIVARAGRQGHVVWTRPRGACRR